VKAYVQGKTRPEIINEMRDDNKPTQDKSAVKPKPKSAQKTYPTIEALRESLRPTPQHTYRYTNPDTGKVDLAVFRIDPPHVEKKRFMQAHEADTGWVLKGITPPMPLYNRTRIRNADQVVLVEGEKAVHALHAGGIVATTGPGGAGKSHLWDLSPLAGKNVIVWPDNDESGKEHARQVCDELLKLDPQPSLSVIDVGLLDLPPKGDAVEFLEKIQELSPKEQAEAIRTVIQDAQGIGPLADLEQQFEDAICGKRFPLPMPWTQITTATRALLPGTVTVLCGSPGATKSFALIQLIQHLTSEGIKVCALALEDDKTYHLRRALAQISGCSDATDDLWCKANPDAIRAIQQKHRSEMQAIQKCIEPRPHGVRMDYKFLVSWVEKKAKLGCKLIAIDPITMMRKSRSGWLDDEEFLDGAKAIVEEHRVSLFLVSHPRKMPAGKSTAMPSMDDLAGGACYSRFCQTVLFLKAIDLEEVTLKNPHGFSTDTINRKMRVFKARNGRGVELDEYGFFFDPQTLKLVEKGLVD
jgi:hypothetical protein